MPSAESGSISTRTTRFVEATLAEDAEAVRERLARQRVQIMLNPSVAETFAGQAVAVTLLNLLVRLDAYCPALEVTLSGAARHPLLRLLEEGSLAAGWRRSSPPSPPPVASPSGPAPPRRPQPISGWSSARGPRRAACPCGRTAGSPT